MIGFGIVQRLYFIDWATQLMCCYYRAADLSLLTQLPDHRDQPLILYLRQIVALLIDNDLWVLFKWVQNVQLMLSLYLRDICCWMKNLTVNDDLGVVFPPKLLLLLPLVLILWGGILSWAQISTHHNRRANLDISNSFQAVCYIISL